MSVAETLRQMIKDMNLAPGAKLLELKIAPELYEKLEKELDGKTAKEVVGVDVVPNNELTRQ